MPPMAEIAVEAAAVARSRRRDSGMRTVMEILRLHEGGEDGGRLSQNADAPQGKLDRFAGRYHSWRTDAPTGLLLRPGEAWQRRSPRMTTHRLFNSLNSLTIRYNGAHT